MLLFVAKLSQFQHEIMFLFLFGHMFYAANLEEIYKKCQTSFAVLTTLLKKDNVTHFIIY